MSVHSRLDLCLHKNVHPEAYFAEERKGWHGYVEWENYPEKKKLAADILACYSFAEVKNKPSLLESCADADTIM